MDDVVDLSVKKSSPSPMPSQSRPPAKSPRLDLPLADPSRLEIPIPMPMAFNHLPPSVANLIPQVQVPHDLTRLVSLLRDREREEIVSTTTGSRGSRPSGLPPTDLSSLFLPPQPHQIPPHQIQNQQQHQAPRQPQTPRKNSNAGGVKRKKQDEDGDVFQHPLQQNSSSNHAVRRSLRPRAERSYAESPDIVVDYEDEPPAKLILNGVTTNGNGIGHVKGKDDDSDTSSDCGEMPPLPVIKELTPREVEERERLLEQLREGVRNEEMKLVLLKKLRQSQMMKENVCIPDSPLVNNGIGTNLSTSANNSILGSGLAPPQSPHHNNQMGMTQGLSMSGGVKGRSSPKLPHATNLSINPNHGTPATQLGSLAGLRLSQHGVTALGLPQQQSNSHRQQHGSPSKGLNSSKVPSLLKGQQPQAPLNRGNLPNAHNLQSTAVPSLMMPPQRSSSSNSISHNMLLAQAQQSLLRGSRNQSGQATAANMMLSFGGTPPGAIPPPTISPALDKYDRPKEAHSGSTSGSQLLSSSAMLEGKLSGTSSTSNLGGGSVMISPSTGPAPTISSASNLASNLNVGVPLPPTLDQAERRHRLATSGEEERETPAQRQAAAKLALRKQLEKTLLQIPPPKPPPPEMNFIPNPNNMEFLALIGLEFVVDYITTKDSKYGPKYPEAVVCTQCKTDFSSMWKIDKGKVICEQCATSNAKKSLKAEHTNRLKTAFVQALQQEQEIEQRLAQGGSLAETLASAGTTVRATSTPSPNHTVMERDHRSPQLISSSTSSNRNRTPTQSPGLGNIPLALPVRDRERERDREQREREQRDREREQRDRERDREQREQRDIREAISAFTAAQQQQQQMQHAAQKERERDGHNLSTGGRERGSSNARAAAAAAAAAATNESLLNLSTHGQSHNFSQQLRHEMAQLAQLHEQQFQQQQLQQQLQQQRHSSKSQPKSSGNGGTMNLSSRGEKRDRERGGEAYRLERDHNSAAASSLLSQTLAQTMANQFMSHGLQNLSMGQQPSVSSSAQKPSQAPSTSRRGPRTTDQAYKQPSMSKQQKLDADAAAKFASAMGMSGPAAAGMGLNPNAVAAALQAAAHQQMLRMPQNQQLPAHLFSPLLYPYQMAMAQAASSGKPLPQASLAELQRQAENLQQLQRQYLLDMIPNSRNLPQNWKT